MHYQRPWFLALLLAAGAFVYAQEARTVYIIRGTGEASALWAEHMALPSEAVRLYTPSSFTKKPFSINLSSDGAFSYSATKQRDLERSAANILTAYDVSIRGLGPLPKPDKRAVLRFTLAELMKAGGPARDSPGLFAIRKAIETGPYRSGRAWLEAISYEGGGVFRATVALSKK
ncbi:MAG TPA: hypothetical protein DCG47_01110 [Spirochaetaceae bacterium]|jgi:hypothetical protein|nr:hypothetical protein [Spirochaetaceae bacterium]